MVLRAKQIFDKAYLDREHPSDFIEFILFHGAINLNLSLETMDSAHMERR